MKRLGVFLLLFGWTIVGACGSENDWNDFDADDFDGGPDGDADMDSDVDSDGDVDCCDLRGRHVLRHCRLGNQGRS